MTQLFSALMLLLLLFSTEGWELQHTVVGEIISFVGVLFVALSVVGRAWSLSYIAGNKGKRLVETGPYSICRNPLYFSNFVGALGLALCTETFILPFLVVMGFVLVYPVVIRREEKKLSDRFREKYTSYCERIPRFFPSFKAFQENEKVIVSARLFRDGLIDLSAFIIVMGLIELVEDLHLAHILPAFFTLY